jgi:cytoskeleton protein RodZ
MSEPLDIGDVLKAAREAKGWTPQEAATKLRLMVRQVEAMEAEEYAALGQPVFARGFVRNYAKLLGIDPDPLLTRMAETGAAPAEKAEAESYAAESSPAVSPILIVTVAALALVLAIPVALYLWLNSGGDEEQQAEAAAAAAPAPSLPAAPLPAPLPETGNEAAAPADTIVQAGAAPAATPAPVAGKAEPPVTPAAALEPAPRPLPPMPEPMPEQGVPEAAAEVRENPYLPSNFRNKSIRLQFDQDAWVQIRDGNGKTIYATLNKAGSTAELSGRPPFDFVVGNASNVRMSYNGRPFDIKPYIGETVARFTLE